MGSGRTGPIKHYCFLRHFYVILESGGSGWVADGERGEWMGSIM